MLLDVVPDDQLSFQRIVVHFLVSEGSGRSNEASRDQMEINVWWEVKERLVSDHRATLLNEPDEAYLRTWAGSCRR